MIDISKDPHFDIRYTKLEEGPVLKKWLMIPEVKYWFPPETEGEVDIFANNWIGFSRFNCSLSAIYKEKLCGIGTLFLMPYQKVKHLCLGYIIVDPVLQRKGIGTALTRNLKHLAKQFFRLESMHFEVYEGCSLISILKKQGFKEIFKQEQFVKTESGYLARIVYETEFS